MKYLKLIGALTNKPYAFQHRPWELACISTIDISDNAGCQIKVYTYGSEIKRILPGHNIWISNKTRYFFEGLVKWRVNIPMVRKKNNLIYVSWTQSFFYLSAKLWFLSFFFKSNKILLLQSFLIDYELLITSKLLTKKIGVYLYLNTDIKFNDFYLTYINPCFFQKITTSKIIFFIGLNLRLEAPILALKLRKNLLKNISIFCSIGSLYNDTLNSVLLGVNLKTVIALLKGKLTFCKLILKFTKSKNKNLFSTEFENKFLFLLGNSVIKRADNIQIIKYLKNYENKKTFYKNFVSNKHYLYLDYVKMYLTYNIYIQSNITYANNNLLYVINLYLTSILYKELNMYQNIHVVSNLNLNKIIYMIGNVCLTLKNTKLYIYQGHHINKDYLKVDIIYPSATFFEKASNFLNVEGRILKTNRVMSAPKYSRNDWSILNAVYIYLYNFVKKIYNLSTKKPSTFLNSKGFKLFLQNKKKLINFVKKISVNFYYKTLTNYYVYNYINLYNLYNLNAKTMRIFNSMLNQDINNFYNMDIISKNAKTLKLCAHAVEENYINYKNIN